MWNAAALAALLADQVGYPLKKTATQAPLQVESLLQAGHKKYLFASRDFALSELSLDAECTARVRLTAEGSAAVWLTFIPLDAQGEQLAVLNLRANQAHTVQFPAATHTVRLAVRFEGPGVATLQQLEWLGHPAVSTSPALQAWSLTVLLECFEPASGYPLRQSVLHQALRIESKLTGKNVKYLFSKRLYSPEELGVDASRQLRFRLQASGSLATYLAVVPVTAQGENLPVIARRAGLEQSIELPESTRQVRLGLRFQGGGETLIEQIQWHTAPVAPAATQAKAPAVAPVAPPAAAPTGEASPAPVVIASPPPAVLTTPAQGMLFELKGFFASKASYFAFKHDPRDVLIRTAIRSGEHKYLYGTRRIELTELQLTEARQLFIELQCVHDMPVELAIVPHDQANQKLPHHMLAVNQVHSIQLPPQAVRIAVGLRIAGTGQLRLKSLYFGAAAPVAPKPAALQAAAPVTASVPVSLTSIDQLLKQVKPVSARPTMGCRRERVRIGIVSIEIRRSALQRVVEALYPQADELFVYLNDFAQIPDFLKKPNISVLHGLGDVGDRGKFYGVDDFEGYFITCDDDIDYPPYYVDHLIDGIERYGRQAVVGWHGSVFLDPFEDYYTATSRRVFSFKSGRPADTAVHVLGTGCSAFHTSTIRVRYDDFKTPNMADVYLAVLGKQQAVPFVVLKHDGNEALPIEIPDDKPINQESAKSTGSKADTRALQNKLVKENLPWHAELPKPVYVRQVPTVAYMGRLNVDRWKKGGILKSGHLILQTLRKLGHRVIPVEIEQDVPALKAAVKDAQVVWIYPGDPERPDFAPVEQLIEHSAALGKQVYVNLSLNLVESRTDWIVKRMTEWRSRFGARIKACVFSYSVIELEALAPIRDLLVCIPKTIQYDPVYQAAFEHTQGIFLGDLQKLLNRGLVHGDIEDWIAPLRQALPGVPLYAVRQYGGKVDRDLGLTVVPYTHGPEWEQWLATLRIACCMTPHATYEMVPVECAGLGVPVVYRPMIHAHSEVLSFAGVQVDTPEQFAAACKMLYTDPVLWESHSRAISWRAYSQHVEFVGAAIHRQIVMGQLSGSLSAFGPGTASS